MKRAATSMLFFALLILIWEALSRTGWYSPVLLPSPLFVGEYLWQSARDGTLWTATFVTMRRLSRRRPYFQVNVNTLSVDFFGSFRASSETL